VDRQRRGAIMIAVPRRVNDQAALVVGQFELRAMIRLAPCPKTLAEKPPGTNRSGATCSLAIRGSCLFGTEILQTQMARLVGRALISPGGE
jgi:hypothetical protein